MPKRDSLTSPRDARAAVIPENQAEAKDLHSSQHVLHAAARLRFLSSLRKAEKFTVANATLREAKI